MVLCGYDPITKFKLTSWSRPYGRFYLDVTTEDFSLYTPMILCGYHPKIQIQTNVVGAIINRPPHHAIWLYTAIIQKSKFKLTSWRI
jgi:hypothetical protein